MITPILFGKPIFVWFGLVAALLLIFQMAGGFMMVKKGKMEYLKYHKWNAVLLGLFALLHLFYTLRLYF